MLRLVMFTRNVLLSFIADAVVVFASTMSVMFCTVGFESVWLCHLIPPFAIVPMVLLFRIHETLYVTFTLLAAALVTVTEWLRSKSLPQSLVMSLTFPRVSIGPRTVTVLLLVDALS